MAMTLLAACTSLRGDFSKPVSTALPASVDSQSAQYIDSETNKQALHESGFRLLTLNTNALMSRVVLARKAERSLDLQYYIFSDDATGKLVAQQLLQAADRGVRVRLLLDDITQDDQVPLFNALDAHDNIEVRLFNPFNTRQPSALSKAAQMLLDFRRLNRRMHNKSFIADNKIAIVGGRNIGDEYFDAGKESNFRDLDLLAIGPVVEQASRSFDSYWNDEAAIPVNAYHAIGNPEKALPELRAKLDKHARTFANSDYAQAAIDDMPNGATADRRGQWFWGEAVLVADQPEKIEVGEEEHGLRIGTAVQALMAGAQSEVQLMSPYFVPGKEDVKRLVALAQRGVVTRILTNSLASTDQRAVHSGYAAHRKDLLSGGVELFEMKPWAGVLQTASQLDKDAQVSLHAKSLVVDRRLVFIGSMNMDHRSKLLNTEMGFIVDSPKLAGAVVDFFRTVTLPANAYALALADRDDDGQPSGEILWRTELNGKPLVLDSEPEVGLLEKAEVMLYKMLPIDGLL
jgi:putative cardiolipin synthase